jgi:hypothetical protein
MVGSKGVAIAKVGSGWSVSPAMVAKVLGSPSNCALAEYGEQLRAYPPLDDDWPGSLTVQIMQTPVSVPA